MAEGAAHVVFGAGQIGPLLAERLARFGKAVRVVRRSAARVPIPGIELVRGDALDPGFCAEVVRGAEAVYHCMNVAYLARAWQEALPRLQANLVAASSRSGARLVVLDNVYSLGRTGGKPMSEDTPAHPCSRKGAIRARLHEELLAAARRGDLRVVVGRASDFYGPGAGQSHLGERVLRPLLQGRAAQLVVNPDPPHTYHFTRDVAAGLATLGVEPGADGTWMLPCAPAVSTRAMVAKLAGALGSAPRLRRMPPALLALLGLAVPMLREVNEMAYQWEEPFVVDDRRFRERFGAGATPLDEGARETAAWAREAYRE